MKKDPLIFINHILESIANIENFSKGITKDELPKSVLKQYAIVRAIEIIGEAVKNIPKDFTSKYSEIPWKKIAGMRDKIIHQYFDIDFNLVWLVLEDDLPDLKKKIKRILEKEKQKDKKD